MDTIGLLAAWTSVISFLLSIAIAIVMYFLTPVFQTWWATTSPERARRRIRRLCADIESSKVLGGAAALSQLISLYGAAILNLVAAAALTIVSIEILDLGPSMLASTLPFNIDSKMLTRITGLCLMAISYLFIFRLSYLGIRIERRIAPLKPGYAQRALKETSRLREMYSLGEKDVPVDLQSINISACEPDRG